VVEALIALNYLKYEGKKVNLTAEADNILFNPDHHQYIGFSFMHTYNIMKVWTQLPEVIKMMQPELDPGLPIKMVKGDFTEGLPPGPYDLVYLGNVCHIYGERENRKLFRDAAQVLKPGGQIVIVDMLRGYRSYARAICGKYAG